MPMSKKFKAALLGSVLFVSSVSGAHGADLIDELNTLLTTHDQIKAAEADVKAAEANVAVAEGDYYPTASVTANFGHEKIDTANPTSTATESGMAQREVDLSLEQTLYDFGATDATVDSAALSLDQAKETLEQTRQSILLAALSAQLNLASAKRVLDYQIESEASILRQTELEDARVQRGSGFSTDVLQAKTQLAGAQAQRVAAEGAMEQAINRYRAVFGYVPDDIAGLDRPILSSANLPTTEEDVVAVALDKNPQVRVSAIQAEIADTAITQTFATNYRPTVTASAEQKFKRDVGGTIGRKNERLVKVEATFDFNFGWIAENSVKASQFSHSAAASRLKDTRDQIEEQARNAWRQLITARTTAEFRENQANIAGEFLDLARKERTLGQRSLIDVLSGETAHINALAAADQAKTQADVAALTVLSIMGELDVSVLQ